MAQSIKPTNVYMYIYIYIVSLAQDLKSKMIILDVLSVKAEVPYVMSLSLHKWNQKSWHYYLLQSLESCKNICRDAKTTARKTHAAISAHFSVRGTVLDTLGKGTLNILK